MEGFNVDSLARIKQRKRGDGIRGIEGDEYLWKTEVYRGGFESGEKVRLALYGSRICRPYAVDHG